ncbi:protein of unknown function [Vibrio tapetis subsp. tapetis]|uniref:Uncharacterized protein n=1 Tax=Vibrio tapetis subsp. tapetis TaxID=1671868 RepID=A0A2N8ZKK7_9VIBR|nr:protein of unknown function [Vibrio tapetis subsp. tapetis]
MGSCEWHGVTDYIPKYTGINEQLGAEQCDSCSVRGPVFSD